MDHLRARLASSLSTGDVGILLRLASESHLNGLAAEFLHLLPNCRICVETSDHRVLSVHRNNFAVQYWEALLIDPEEKRISDCKLYSVTMEAAATYILETMNRDPRLLCPITFEDNTGLPPLRNMPSDVTSSIAHNLVEISPQLQLFYHAASLIGRSCVSMESCGDDAVLFLADDLVHHRDGQPGFRVKVNGKKMSKRVHKAIFLRFNAPYRRPEIESCSWKHVHFGSVEDHDFSVARNLGMQAVVISSKCAVCSIKERRMWKCASCKAAVYCSRYCQKLHWPLHKPTCTRITGHL